MTLNQLIEVLIAISQNHPKAGEMSVVAEGHFFAGYTHFRNHHLVCGARVDSIGENVIIGTFDRRSSIQAPPQT